LKVEPHGDTANW